jgi:hypothetical protein
MFVGKTDGRDDDSDGKSDGHALHTCRSKREALRS